MNEENIARFSDADTGIRIVLWSSLGVSVLSPFPNLKMQHNKKRSMLILVEKS
jgi:hypothetical protein